MNCHNVEQHVELYVLGALAQEVHEAVRQHLDACADCRAKAAHLRGMMDTFRAAVTAPSEGDPALRELRRRVGQEIWTAKARETREMHLPMLAKVAAALLLSAGLLYGVYGLAARSGGEACACGPWTHEGIRSCATDGAAYPMIVEKSVLAVEQVADGPHLLAMERHTGARQWSTPFRVAGCPVTDRERVYVWKLENQGVLALAALDRKTGAVLWTRASGPATGRGQPMPLEVHDNGVCWSERDRVTSVDGGTGQPRWSQPIQGEGALSAPMVSAGGLFVASGQALYRLDPATGQIEWKRVHAQPAVTLWKPLVQAGDGLVAVALGTGLGRGQMQCCDAQTGDVLWTKDTEVPRHMAVDGGRVYVRAGAVAAFEGHTGKLAWSVPMSGCSPISAAGDTVYVVEGKEGKGLHALRADTGASVWAKELASSCSGLVVAGRMAYLSGHDGSLHALVIGRRG